MKFYAIIPARKGSKRLPGKNKKLLGGKPLIQWTIECAKAVNEFENIIVSTDDPEIAEIGENLGCTVPGLRNSDLASDTANLVDVCLDIAKKFQMKNDDVMVLLQPTSPFRRPETVLKGLSIMKHIAGHGNVISFSPCQINPEWIHYIDDSGQVHSMWDKKNILNQRQKFKYIIPNGLFYSSKIQQIKKYNNFFIDKTWPLIIEDPIETHDIDTEVDWENAQLFVQEYSKK